MSQGRVYKKQSGKWAIDYSYCGRRHREVIGSSKKLAQTVLNKRLTEIAENRYLDIVKQKSIKFKDFAHNYLETHSKPNKKSWKSSDQNSLKHLVPEFGNYFLHEVTGEMIEKYKTKRKEKVSVSSVNRELTCLKTMYSKAIQWKYIKENPMNGVKHFKERNERTRYLENEEMNELLECCSDRLKTVVLTAVNTGMRKGELQRLKWRDIDFSKGFIKIHEAKNGESRLAYMPENLKQVIMSIKKHPDSPYVFVKKDGRPYNFRKAFETALKRSGIEDFRFHDLRHTFASKLAMRGVDLNTIRELLGHKSLAMTLRYSHLSKDHKMRAVQVLNSDLDTKMTFLSKPLGPVISKESLTSLEVVV